jgi:hypothetical protein
VLAGEPIALVPERGLPDSRIALEQQRVSAGGNSPQKAIQRLYFLAPTDELECHRTCSAGRSRPTPPRVHNHAR